MNRILTLYLFLLLCGTASAQQIVKWDDLQTITDNARRTVYYEKGSKQPLQGEYRIIRGLDEERVKLSDGIINGDYLRYRDGVLRESGKAQRHIHGVLPRWRYSPKRNTHAARQDRRNCKDLFS